MSKLSALSLGRNRFTGQLPSSIFNLPQVLSLAFQHNNFEGSLPEFKNGLPKLSYLDFSSCFLNGTIPPWIFGLPSLQFLYLQNNHLSGNISEAPSKSLQSIDLGGNSLSGSIPRSFYDLQKMTDLRLSSNTLNGVVEIDLLFSKLRSLELLDLSGNNFSLIINNSVNFALPTLSTLSLSSCNIKEFPHVLKAFVNIQILDLSHNKNSWGSPPMVF
ncbi:receptor like protein 28-like [Ziziphus jujuba]|uniref:Receptor like protein 28-like n=1 Tax=Ziziphus jujuba TaxID=326968 RepID=A0ABM3ZU92_ZIZJJ|nr:receptor like protein 28-like [Ziziphus jujuba]